MDRILRRCLGRRFADENQTRAHAGWVGQHHRGSRYDFPAKQLLPEFCITCRVSAGKLEGFEHQATCRLAVGSEQILVSCGVEPGFQSIQQLRTKVFGRRGAAAEDQVRALPGTIRITDDWETQIQVTLPRQLQACFVAPLVIGEHLAFECSLPEFPMPPRVLGIEDDIFPVHASGLPRQ
ncbi:hypothetical protein F0M17_11000 [Glutamicibacter sp. ZJUTW]|nr:hypothetical protein F0M17_11000 [Glutamicibacter sp. ZJUTW]